MDLHVYRNSQDRWYDLRSTARERGAVLATNAATIDELVERLTPDVQAATPGQRLAILGTSQTSPRYEYDAVAELKAARIRPAELRAAGVSVLADILERYDKRLRELNLCDPQDRRALAASRVKEGAIPWLRKFERVVLHALYDLTETEFLLIRSLIEALPEGGTVILFNTTANVKPTQFAEWTWQRFVYDESLAERTFPEFCRVSRPGRSVLEHLFRFEPHEPLPVDDSLRIIQASGRYREVQIIGSDIAELLMRGESPHEIAVVVRHIETYGEMIEDVFTRYGIPHQFETGVPLLRVPFIKYWLALLDLVVNDRRRDALARVMASAYFTPRISGKIDVERELSGAGYIDRNHLRASALAARRNSPLTPELQRFEQFLDQLEASRDTVVGFLNRLQPHAALTERDRQAFRVLSEECDAVGTVREAQARQGAASSNDRALEFKEFRKLASEIAALRTVDRSNASAAFPGVPRVRVVSPHSLGYREYRWIFAPGFADGEFPGRSASNPLLPDETIEAINACIRPRRMMTSRNRNRKEPLYLFMILDSASKRVTLTWPGSTLEGETIYPSVYVGEVCRHYEESPVTQTSLLSLPRGEGEWLSVVANEWRRGTLSEMRAEELLGKDIVERAKLEAKGIARADLGRGVLTTDRVWHPSELNSLSACSFVFLARHAMKLRAAEAPDFEVPAMEIGILVHSILRDFYSEPVPGSLDAARTRMDNIIARRLAATDTSGQGPYSVFDPSLWKIRRQQVVSVVKEYVKFAVRDALDGFETQLEYLDSALPPARLSEILLSGRPDHVAVHRSGGCIDAFRIDDFKYSAASASTARLLKESFQIPVYAYLAMRALGTDESVRIDGRYLLLRSPGNPVVSYPIDNAVFEGVRVRMDELIAKVRAGFLRPAPTEKQDCADCEYRRLCRFYSS
jgi:ATP-dependent helicase/DNAse subunit B